jgi:cytochrome d ubiquinol oxidase subunit II
MLPSDTDPSSSLTVWDASSSQTTLFIMLIAVIIFLPIIVAYTSWVFSVMRGKVTAAYIAENKHTLY